jgi:multiple sugar transport system substrate-binding protein
MTMNKILTRRGLLHTSAVGFAAALALGLSGCGGASPTTQQTVNSDAVEAALQKGGKLTVWAWDPMQKQVV